MNPSSIVIDDIVLTGSYVSKGLTYMKDDRLRPGFGGNGYRHFVSNFGQSDTGWNTGSSAMLYFLIPLSFIPVNVESVKIVSGDFYYTVMGLKTQDPDPNNLSGYPVAFYGKFEMGYSDYVNDIQQGYYPINQKLTSAGIWVGVNIYELKGSYLRGNPSGSGTFADKNAHGAILGV
jgi:hypothetical protein